MPNATTHGSGFVPDRLEAIGRLAQYTRSMEIHVQGDTAENWSVVVAGAACQSVVRTDGRRNVVDLLLPGDDFGLLATDAPGLSVHAICTPTIVAHYRKSLIEAIAAEDPKVALHLRERMRETAARLIRHVLLLQKTTAKDKVWGFLKILSARTNDGEIQLAISRYDIADYLGLSVETVSRAMTELQFRGRIELRGPRRVKTLGRPVAEQTAA